MTSEWIAGKPGKSQSAAAEKSLAAHVARFSAQVYHFSPLCDLPRYALTGEGKAAILAPWME